MEFDQYNFKQFQDGLTDILNKPWKEPAFIQDAIPTFPEENDEDRLLHNIIMLQFIGERLLRPYYSTLGYLLLNKVYFLKFILEKYSTKEDFVAMFKGSSRLTSNEIYEAFNGMSPTNASFLLDRIGCPVSVYTRLKESLERKEETKFAEDIDECDISNILPALKYILFIKQQVKKLDSPDPQGKEGTNMDFETAKQKLLYEIEADMTEKHGISPNSPLKQESMAFFDELLKLTNNPNELLESFYPPLFWQYCQMKDGGGLNDSDVKAFEYIFHQPAFEEQYNESLKQWMDGIRDKYIECPVEAVDGELNGDAKEKKVSVPQEFMGINNSLKHNQIRKKGRPKSSWIKGRSSIKEEAISSLIERDIWKWLIDLVGELKFNYGIAGQTRDKQIKNFSAGLIYYAAEKIGWAEVYTNDGIQSSFSRTMAFAKISRTSFEKNIRYIHEWYNLADQYKDYPNQFDESYRNNQDIDPNIAFLIFKNVEEIGAIIEKLETRLQKTFDENCKL